MTNLIAAAFRVQGADGHAVVFAFAELDPSLGDRRVHLVDRVDDKPLSPDDGPWRLVVPRDLRGGRWVRQVIRISVVDLPWRRSLDQADTSVSRSPRSRPSFER